MKKNHFILAFFILAVMIPYIGEAQCAMCKAAVESSAGQKNSVAGGINQGIIYLMIIPYFMLAFIFRKQLAALWRSIRGKEVDSEDL